MGATTQEARGVRVLTNLHRVHIRLLDLLDKIRADRARVRRSTN